MDDVNAAMLRRSLLALVEALRAVRMREERDGSLCWCTERISGLGHTAYCVTARVAYADGKREAARG